MKYSLFQNKLQNIKCDHTTCLRATEGVCSCKSKRHTHEKKICAFYIHVGIIFLNFFLLPLTLFFLDTHTHTHKHTLYGTLSSFLSTVLFFSQQYKNDDLNIFNRMVQKPFASKKITLNNKTSLFSSVLHKHTHMYTHIHTRVKLFIKCQKVCKRKKGRRERKNF